MPFFGKKLRCDGLSKFEKELYEEIFYSSFPTVSLERKDEYEHAKEYAVKWIMSHSWIEDRKPEQKTVEAIFELAWEDWFRIMEESRIQPGLFYNIVDRLHRESWSHDQDDEKKFTPISLAIEKELERLKASGFPDGSPKYVEYDSKDFERALRKEDERVGHSYYVDDFYHYLGVESYNRDGAIFAGLSLGGFPVSVLCSWKTNGSPYHTICYITTNCLAQGRGYASKLLDAFYAKMKERGETEIGHTFFSDTGGKELKPLLEKLGVKYGLRNRFHD